MIAAGLVICQSQSVRRLIGAPFRAASLMVAARDYFRRGERVDVK